MSEREEWRERMRGRLRREQPADPVVEQLIAASAARPRNRVRSWERGGAWGRYDVLRERFAAERERKAEEERLVGERECRYCQQVKPVALFTSTRWKSMCVDCRREYDRRRRMARRDAARKVLG